MQLIDIGRLLLDAGKKFLADRCQSWGAAIAFYTLLSLSPLLVAVVAIAGFVFGSETASAGLMNQVETVIGAEAANIMEQVMKASSKAEGGILAGIIGIVTLLLGASMVFTEMQTALNAIWNVPGKPAESSGIFQSIYQKLMSFSLVAGTAFLLLVSLVVNTVLHAVTSGIAGYIPDWAPLAWILNFVVTVGLIALMFAMMFKVLPQTQLAWSDVWVGAIITSLLFGLGRYLIGLYLGQAAVGSAYGAAGALVVVLVWVYYSTQIMLFGAELTFLYAGRFGSGVWNAQGEKVREPLLTASEPPRQAGDEGGESNPIARNERKAIADKQEESGSTPGGGSRLGEYLPATGWARSHHHGNGTRNAHDGSDDHPGSRVHAMSTTINRTTPYAATDDGPSVTGLLSGIVQDTQTLFGQQVLMLKSEIKEDFRRSKRAAEFASLSIVLLTVGALAMVFCLAWLLHEQFQLHLWVSFGITGALFLVAGGILGVISYILLERFNPLPDKTLQTIKENISWDLTK